MDALKAVLVCEPNIFNEVQLDSILSIIVKFELFNTKADNYLMLKSTSEKPVGHQLLSGNMVFAGQPMPTIQEKVLYEGTNFKQINDCRVLLKKIKDVVFEVRENRLASFVFEGINLELNQDQEVLKGIIKEFNFDPDLNDLLDKVNQKIYEAEDKIDFKGCIDLIRTFLEKLCILIASEIYKIKNIPPGEQIDKIGRARNYFRDSRVKFLSIEEDELLEKIYSFMSHKGAHVLKSDKEYARISKNIVIEMGLFLMKRLNNF